MTYALGFVVSRSPEFASSLAVLCRALLERRSLDVVLFELVLAPNRASASHVDVPWAAPLPAWRAGPDVCEVKRPAGAFQEVMISP